MSLASLDAGGGPFIDQTSAAGRDFRLTDVEGKVVKGLIA
jgi:hypothetical protein